ncbi:MAG: hypothetical protein IJF14_00785 [Clostridia bacterium]|nr:hypothetical protein [Clostridia bacterium]
MDLNYFKDHLWDMLNDDDCFNVQDIISNDKENSFDVIVHDESVFHIVVSQKLKML